MRLKKLLAAVAWLIIWQALSMLVGSELLLPSPVRTVECLFTLAQTGEFWKTIGLSLVRVGAGFLLGMAVGCALGVVTAFSGTAEVFLSPLRAVVKATPVTSLIVLVLLWLSKSVAPVFMAFLMVMPIAWSNIAEGIKSADGQLIEMANAFGLDAGKKLHYIYVPSVMPQFVAACTTGLGFAWKSGVAAEVIARPEFSIGKSIYESKIYLEVPELFAWTAAIVILSMALEKTLVSAIRRLMHDKA